MCLFLLTYLYFWLFYSYICLTSKIIFQENINRSLPKKHQSIQVLHPLVPEPAFHTHLKSPPWHSSLHLFNVPCFGFILQTSNMYLDSLVLWLFCFISWILPPGCHRRGSTEQSPFSTVLGAPYLYTTLTVLIYLPPFFWMCPLMEFNKIKWVKAVSGQRRFAGRGATWPGLEMMR